MSHLLFQIEMLYIAALACAGCAGASTFYYLKWQDARRAMHSEAAQQWAKARDIWLSEQETVTK